jgi:branched-chain amino acid transport system substrate-binding protein
VLGGGFNYKFVKELPDVAQNMIDTNHWFDPTNPRAQAMKKRVEAKGDLFTFEVYLSYNAVKFLAEGMERAASADKEKVNASLAASAWSDHFMPYGPTKMVNGQNTGGKASIQQASRTDIEVIWPARFASAKPVFPKPKFT